MATRRSIPTRFNRDNRIRVRDNIKVKRIIVMSPYVISGREISPGNTCDIIEVIIPLAGTIYNIITSSKDIAKDVIHTLYKNDEELDTDIYGQTVEEGDTLKYTLRAEDGRVNVASKVLCSIVILPTYNKDFVLNKKVDEE